MIYIDECVLSKSVSQLISDNFPHLSIVHLHLDLIYDSLQLGLFLVDSPQIMFQLEDQEYTSVGIV